MNSTANIQSEIEHLFRTQSGRIVARLVRLFGTENIDLAENVVQEALIAALQTWPHQGIPDNPAAWITQVAKNKALDALRRNRFLCHDPAAMDFPVAASDEKLKNEFLEDELKLLFITCHPVLSPEVQVALALKMVCGFGVSEIARAFFAKEDTIAQRIVRAKQKVRSAKLAFELPPLSELRERLDVVLQTLYLVFNEGYSATSGEDLIRRDVCFEAIRLAEMLLKHPAGQQPHTHALLALMHFQSSRFECRLDSAGNIVLLEDQDRSLWNKDFIRGGISHMEKAANGEHLSCYHIEAGIAACHATAASFSETNWEHIVEYYDLLLQFKDTAIVRLNRAAAIGMKDGAAAGASEVESLLSRPEFSTSMLFPATLADFYRRMGKREEAMQFYNQALGLVKTEPENKFLTKRILELK